MARWMRTLLMFCTFAALTSAAVGGIALAGNWERFRGPNGTGTVSDKDVPVTFGAKENLLWKIAIPGAGNGSPILFGKRIFLQSATSKGKERTLFCFDTQDGKILWKKSIPGITVQIRADS